MRKWIVLVAVQAGVAFGISEAELVKEIREACAGVQAGRAVEQIVWRKFQRAVGSAPKNVDAWAQQADDLTKATSDRIEADGQCRKKLFEHRAAIQEILKNIHEACRDSKGNPEEACDEALLPHIAFIDAYPLRTTPINQFYSKLYLGKIFSSKSTTAEYDTAGITADDLYARDYVLTPTRLLAVYAPGVVPEEASYLEETYANKVVVLEGLELERLEELRTTRIRKRAALEDKTSRRRLQTSPERVR